MRHLYFFSHPPDSPAFMHVAAYLVVQDHIIPEKRRKKKIDGRRDRVTVESRHRAAPRNPRWPARAMSP